MNKTVISLNLCNLVIVLTFDTFKLKLFDPIDCIGFIDLLKVIRHQVAYIGIETSEFVTVELNSFFWSVVSYSATF